MTRRVWERCRIGAAVTLTAACAATGRPGESSSYLIVESLVAASGARPSIFSGTLGSDVQTMVTASGGETPARVPTVLEDVGQALFRLAMKDPAVTASAVNAITITRYRVVFRRADGRNTPGVDVPFGFDGALTLTVGEEPASVDFTLVRIQAKSEPPLRALIGGGGALAISTMADITFYGTDQAGREVMVSARISVTFADWLDPD